MKLGELEVTGAPPAKFLKALAAISTLHEVFDTEPWIAPGWSRQSCILCALTVRDFLRTVGFADATVRSVAVVMTARQNGETLHSLGIGDPTDKRFIEGRWVGHLVATVPSLRFLVDPTLTQAQRPQWPQLPGIMACPIARRMPKEPFRGLPLLTGYRWDDRERDYEFSIVWLDAKDRHWQDAPDADPWRRERVVTKLVAAFGVWHG